MLSNEEEISILIDYLNKLEKFIKDEPSFNFGNKKIYDKKRVDDILCCVDSSMPSEFNKYLNTYGENKEIKTFKYRRKLIENIKIKPPIGNNSDFVNYSETLQAINFLKKCIPPDISYIRANYPNLY